MKPLEIPLIRELPKILISPERFGHIAIEPVVTLIPALGEN